jgi:beta-glucosidase
VEGLPKDNGWSVRWLGTLVPRTTGRHTFTIGGAGSARLYLDDKLVARYDHVDFGTVAYASIILKSTQAVKLRVEYTPRESAPIPAMDMLGTTLGTKMQLGWAEPDTRIADAVALARRSDVALVFAADNHGEGADRSTLSLPGDQDELIAAVAAANPRTIVILNTAGAVTMPWADNVSAILEMWYPGDALGQASSRLLFGDAAPAGRLPITFPASESQGPAVVARNYPGTVDANGALDKAYFDEGLLTGYRWFDAKNQKPLFPFGHGLSYSPISIDNVKLSQGAESPRVTATLRNAGTRADSEVLQVYLGFPASTGEPPKRLAAFSKVQLAASSSRSVEIALPDSAFEVWDEVTDRWVVREGSYTVMVGRSSRDIVFKAVLQRGAAVHQ